MAKATYLRLNKRGPATLTIMGIVGEPLYRGGTIRLTNQDHIDKLIGDDTNFKTEYQDGSTGLWFDDVTAEYAHREQAVKAKPASIIGKGEQTSSELENDDEPEEESEEEETEEESEDEAQAEETTEKTEEKPAAKPAAKAPVTQRQRGATTAKDASKK